MSPLRIVSMHTTHSGHPYISFSDGAMPGCYLNSGGRLRKDNDNFDLIYAQVLT